MFLLNSVVFEDLVLLSLRASSVTLRLMGGGVVDDKFVSLGKEMRELLDNRNSTSSETVL